MIGKIVDSATGQSALFQIALVAMVPAGFLTSDLPTCFYAKAGPLEWVNLSTDAETRVGKRERSFPQGLGFCRCLALIGLRSIFDTHKVAQSAEGVEHDPRVCRYPLSPHSWH